jgi:hypothetical protein
MKHTTTREDTMITHGPVLVHSITGEPRNLLQEVSVPRGSTPPQGFKYSSGWMDRDGSKWDLYTKELPLN